MVSEDSLIEPVIGFAGVVALDGPSGTGKSTVARGLARRLRARYLDTGAMYRAATLAVLEAGVDLGDVIAVAHLVRDAGIEISTDPDLPAVRLGGRAIDAQIRQPDVTAAVSAVSANADVRTQLVDHQRRLIGPGAIVVEGRDIGTVVWPAARPKVYLTADVTVRGQRRAAELGSAEVATIAAALDSRDALDSARAVSPLVRALDAVELDTTYLSIEEVVDRLVDMTMTAMAEAQHGDT